MAFTGYGFRLRAFEPGGELLGNIPQPLKVTFSTYESDTSALQVTYPKGSPGLEHFYNKKEIVVDATYGGVIWQEGYDSRFIPVTYEDDVLDENQVVVFTCVGLSFLLTKAIVGAQSESEFKADIGQARNEEKAARVALEEASDPVRGHLRGAAGFKNSWLDLPILFEINTPSTAGPTGQIWINTTGQRRANWRMADNKGWNRIENATDAQISRAYNAFLAYERTQEDLKAVQARDRISVRSFDRGHAGYILSRLWDDTKLRPGRLGVLQKTWTDTHDSYGNPWPTVNSPTEVKAGTTYENLLQSFVDMGQVAFRFHERKLLLTTGDRGFGVDRSADTVLRYGHNITEAPDRASIKDMAHSVTFIGDEGLVYTLDNDQAGTPWGRWESSVLQTSVADKATGILYSRRALEKATGERIERTRELHFNNDGPWPGTHYLVGDWISGPLPNGKMEKQRVNALTITLDVVNEKFEGNVVLNDRFIERDIRNARQTAMLSSGVSSVGGLGGAPSKQPSADLREPSAPRYLQGGGESFLTQDRGYETVFVIDWWWSGKATDGTEMEARLDTFDVQYRLHKDGSWSGPGNAQTWRSVETVDIINRTAVCGPMATYYPGTSNAASYEFRVRARSKAPVVSDWSKSITLTCPEDDEPPAKPTAPTADGSTPIIQLSWDGKNVEGGAMPYDLKHVIIEQSTNGGATWSAEGMPFFYGADTQPLAATVNQKGVQFMYRLKAVDHTGNESEYSDPSEPVSVTMIVDVDAIQAELDAGHITLENVKDELFSTFKVTRDKLSAEGVMEESVAKAFYGDIASFIKISTTQLMVSDPQNYTPDLSEDINAWTIDSSRVQIGEGVIAGNSSGGKYFAFSPSLGGSATSLRRGILPGEKLGFRFVWDRAGGANGSITLALRFYDSLGALIETASYTYAAESGIGSQINSSALATAPTAPQKAAQIEVRVQYNIGTVTTGHSRLADLRVHRQVGATLIENGAVTTDKLLADSVTAGKIAALAVETGSLAANAVTAGKADITSLKSAIVTADIFHGREMNGNTITGGLFQTQKEANRGIKIDSTGMKMWSPTGAQTMDIDAKTGYAEITGRLRTGMPGQPGINITNAGSSWNGTDQGVWFTMDGTAYGWGNSKPSAAGIFTLEDPETTSAIPLNLRGHGEGGVTLWDWTRLRARDGRPVLMTFGNTAIWGRSVLTVRADNDLELRSGPSSVIKFQQGLAGYDSGTGASANMFMDSNGFLFKSSSAEKYKTNLTEHKPAESILDTPVYRWQDRRAVENYERLKDAPRPLSADDQRDWDMADLTWHVGSTAEAVLEHGGDELVTYRDGEVDGLSYDRMAFLLLPFIKELYGWYKDNKEFIAAMRATN